MVVQQVIQLCCSLKVANLGLFSVTNRLAYKNKEPSKTVYAIYRCSGSIYMKQTKIKQNSVNFQN